MTSVSEWTHMESSMDVMAPSSDLFDGDILGDELMDIYNAAVVGGSDDDGLNGKNDNCKGILLFRERLMDSLT
jgi:ribosomal protein S6E (S10)